MDCALPILALDALRLGNQVLYSSGSKAATPSPSRDDLVLAGSSGSGVLWRADAKGSWIRFLRFCPTVLVSVSCSFCFFMCPRFFLRDAF